MSEISSGLSPDERLAKVICEALVAGGHVPAAKRSEIEWALARGHVTSEDWRLYAELMMPRKPQEGQNVSQD